MFKNRYTLINDCWPNVACLKLAITRNINWVFSEPPTFEKKNNVMRVTSIMWTSSALQRLVLWHFHVRWSSAGKTRALAIAERPARRFMPVLKCQLMYRQCNVTCQPEDHIWLKPTGIFSALPDTCNANSSLKVSHWKCETGKCGTGKFGNRKCMERHV